MTASSFTFQRLVRGGGHGTGLASLYKPRHHLPSCSSILLLLLLLLDFFYSKLRVLVYILRLNLVVCSLSPAMASSSPTRASGKTVPETGYAGSERAGGPHVNFFSADFSLRLLLFATTLTALLVLVTSKQSENVRAPIPPLFPIVTRTAKFQHVPAFIYLLVALVVTCLYSILTLLTSASAIGKSSPSTKLLFHLVLLDALMAGVLAAATGASGAVAYIGLKGNSHVNWNKICNLFDKFCRHVGSAVAVSLVASIVLVALVLLSSYSLYRRSR